MGVLWKNKSLVDARPVRAETDVFVSFNASVTTDNILPNKLHDFRN